MALRDQPYLPLYVQDFLTDEKLIECSASATGIYIRLMCIMHKSDEYGTILLKQKDKQNHKQIINFACKLAKFLPYQISEIEAALIELLAENVLKIEGDSLIQGRMVKDNKISLIRSESGKIGGKNSLGINGKPKSIKSKKFAQAKNQANTENEYVNETDNVIINENEVEDKKKRREKLNFGSLQETFSEKWAEWVDYKKSQHGQVFKTLKTEQISINKLIRISGGDCIIAEKIISESISNLWVGLFELKESKNGTTKKSNGSGNSDSGNDKLGRIPRADLEEFVSRGRIAPLG